VNDVEQKAGGNALPESALPVRRDRVGWVGWSLAVALAVAWHTFWGVWLQASPLPAPVRAPAVPDVSYLPVPDGPASGDALSSDVRALGSPVLFSLPTPMGFSRSALTNEIGSLPPLALPGDTVAFLERAAPVDERVVQVGESLEALMRQSGTRFPLRVPEASALAAPAAVATGETIQVEFLGGLAGCRFQRMELPDDPRVRGDAAWEAGASVDVDAEGRVRHVLLDNPSASAKLNGMLVRALMGWRLEKPGTPHSGRVVLRYPGPTRLAAQGGTPGAP
jgi:hypothetical protein